MDSATKDETLREIERRALEITAALDAQSHTLRAEIDPSVSPAWYAIVTSPDCETLASKHLLRRGFGLFDPMFDEVVIVRGRRRIKQVRLLPGYLLAFVWNIDAQWPRMASCPGVHDLLRRPGTQHVAVIADKIVEYLHGLEMSRSLNNTCPGWASTAAPTRKQKRARRKNGSRLPEMPMIEAEPRRSDEIIFRCKSYMGDMVGLAPADRIDAFAKAIGLIAEKDDCR